MPDLPETFNFGDRSNVTPEKLLQILEDMYEQLASEINQKPNVYYATDGTNPRNGNSEDTHVKNGDFNVNTTSRAVEVATRDETTGAVFWDSIK
ncbi:MAG: hypothetical protein VW258_15045 [Thalassolituus sp.]